MVISDNKLINEIKNVYELNINSLLYTKEHVDERYVKSVKLLSTSKKIIISGVGKSGLIGRKIVATFSSIGFKTFFLHPVEALHGDIGLVESGDCAILISKSGTSEDIIRLIPYLKSRMVKIIAITGNDNSYLAVNADIVLDGSVSKEACPFNITPTTSTLVALAIGDALAISMMIYNNVSVIDFAKNHPLGQIGKNLTLKVRDVMHANDAKPSIKSSASFRDAIIEITNKGLGCVCVIDNDLKLKGIITDGDVRRVLQKYEDIRGLKVETIMTKNPVSIKPDVFLSEALSVMEQRDSQINVLPVTDTKNIYLGIIRIHDIVRSGL